MRTTIKLVDYRYKAWDQVQNIDWEIWTVRWIQKHWLVVYVDGNLWRRTYKDTTNLTLKAEHEKAH